MKEGYRKIWLWLALMMLATVIAGGSYYFGSVREVEYENEGTLVFSIEDNEKLPESGGKETAEVAEADYGNEGSLTGCVAGEENHGC